MTILPLYDILTLLSKRRPMEIITRINWVDILVLIIVLRISYIAFQDGLSHEIFPLIGTVCTLVLSLHYYNKISSFLITNLAKIPVGLGNFLSFFALIIVIGFIFKLIRSIVDKIIKITWNSLIEKFGGLFAGILRAAVVASTVLIIIALMPLSYLQWSIKDRSLVGMYFLRIGPAIHEKVSAILPTIKIQDETDGKENMVQDIISTKSLAPKSKKTNKKVREWEKPLAQ